MLRNPVELAYKVVRTPQSAGKENCEITGDISELVLSQREIVITAPPSQTFAILSFANVLASRTHQIIAREENSIIRGYKLHVPC